MLRYDAVLFDLLTALLDSWTLWNNVAGSAAEGLRWRRAYLKISYETGAYRDYDELTAAAAEAVGLPAALGAELAARYGEIQPWPETQEVLQSLSACGLRLGVVTNCSEKLGRLAAARAGGPFDAIVTAERAGFYKPDVRPYGQALRELGVRPERCLFVAGSAYDLFGTAKLGLDTYWHDRIGLEPPAGAPQPQFHERSLAGLLKIVQCS